MILHFLRSHLDAEFVITGDVLAATRDAPLDWRPHPSSYTLGRLAMHVATIPAWLPAFARSGAYDMGAGGPGPDVPASSDEIFARYEEAIDRAHATLESLHESALTEPWTLLRDGLAVASMTRAEAISRYVVRHMVHHRGQLTVYLRLRDLPIPAMYGDSADRRLLPPDTRS
jgi:uncharacterized damage-inducible protein DinB